MTTLEPTWHKGMYGCREDMFSRSALLREIERALDEERVRISDALDACVCDAHLPNMKKQLEGYYAISNAAPFEVIDIEDDEFIRPAHVYLVDDLPWIEASS